MRGTNLLKMQYLKIKYINSFIHDCSNLISSFE